MSQLGNVYHKYDCNHRVYTDPETGLRSVGVIDKYCWVSWIVIGQTPRSWLLNRSKDGSVDARSTVKVPKKHKMSDHGFMTTEERDESIFMSANRYKTSKRVDELKNADALRHIIAILDANGVK